MKDSYPSADLRSKLDPRLAELLDGYVEQLRGGHSLSVEEFARRNPEFASQLLELLPPLLVLEDLGAPAPSEPDLAQDLLSSLPDVRILREVGRGGMGIVYEAEQISLGRRVALKVLPFAAAADASRLQRFKIEATTAASLSHPHIVTVHDVGHHQGLPYIVMEYLPGGNLATHLPRFRDEPKQAATLVAKVASAVQKLHDRGMVHRDLKPSNIVLDEVGEPRVTDFGLVKLLDGSAGLTGTGHPLGTPCYMAPEATGLVNRPVGTAVDIWALGILLYELVTGRRPFGGANPALFHSIVYQEPTPPQQFQPRLDPVLASLILKCLRKDPALRFSAAGELAADLGDWLAGKSPRHTPQPRGVQRVWHRLGGRPRRITVAALLLTVAMAVPRDWFLNNPEQPWQNVLQEMEAGKKVVLLGATGEPTAPRWLIEKAAQSFPDKDKVFTIHAWDLGLLELARTVPHQTYRLSAKIRHDGSEEREGEVGLFFAYQAVPLGQGKAHLFYKVAYNDLTDLVALPGNLKNPPKHLQLPPGNSVDLRAVAVADLGGPKLWSTAFGGCGVAFFPPAVKKGGVWREIVVEVHADKIQPFFREKLTGPLVNRKVALHLPKQALHLTTEYTKLAAAKNTAFFQNADPKFHPHGALGIFVYRGSASFTDVTLEPLVPAEKGKQHDN